MVIKSIGDWYLFEYYTHLRIYGVIDPPNILLKHVPDRLVLVEISFQTMIVGFNNFLSKEFKKNLFIHY